MARKKRIIEQSPVLANQPAAPVKYQDAFQSSLNQRLDYAGKSFEGKGKTLLYALAAVAVLAVIAGIFYTYNRRQNAAAQTALGKAIETSQAQVTDSPIPAGSTTEKTFKTDKARAEASIAEFQTVADKFGGAAGDKARYFIAVNRLAIDRPQAITDLETLAKSNDEVGKLSKFALAQTRVSDGKLDDAAALYSELAAADSIIAKDTINFNLAGVYEKQGKKDDAANLYFNIAKAAAEAKDLDGKAVPLSQTAKDAKEKLTALNPDKAKEIPVPAPDSSAGGMPFGG